MNTTVISRRRQTPARLSAIACITLLFIVSAFAFYSCNTPAHTHVYTDEVIGPGCTEPGMTVHRCECGDEYTDARTEALGHTFSDNVTPATCSEAGSAVHTCTRCGYTYTDVLEPLGHTFSNPSYSLKKMGTITYKYKCGGVCDVCGETVSEAYSYLIGCGISTGENAEIISGEGGSVKPSIAKDGKLTLTAEAGISYIFKSWSDGCTDITRVLEPGDRDNLFALFDYQAGTMPVMSIVTHGTNEIVSRDYYVDCDISISNCEERYLKVSAGASIRVRGNASANGGNVDWIRQNKVHYRFKFDEKDSILGVNDDAKRKSWVLLRGDNVFLKEPVSFFMFDKLVEGRVFAPDYTFVNVYVNYEYYGVYVLCDQIQLGDSRIDIAENEDDETTVKTGYLLEIDNYYSKEPNYFTVNYGGVRLTDMYGVTYNAPAAGYSVKYDNVTDEMMDYVAKFVRNAYRVVYEAIWNGKFYTLDADNDLVLAPQIKSAREAVANVFDIDAAVSMYIMEELAEERDVGIGSFFMYVDFSEGEPKLTFCAPWDFSWAYGCDSGFSIDSFAVSAWQPKEFINYAGNRSSTWFITLYHADWFVDDVKAKWQAADENGLFDSLYEEMRRVASDYELEFSMNAERWGSGDQAHHTENLIAWLEARREWLDTQWGK